MPNTGNISESSGSEPLSIAVISPNDQRRNAALSALDKFPNGRVWEFMSYPPDVEVVAMMLKQRFDVVVIDLDTDAEYALELIEKVSVGGATSVIVFSGVPNPDLMVRCMRAGAREFLRLPLTSAHMTEALLRAWARRLENPRQQIEAEPETHEEPSSSLLVFFGAKGGAGVTTLATNFAVALAEQSGQRTLLIDLNVPLGDAALNLGIKCPYSTLSALDNAKRLDSQFLSSLIVQHVSGLFVLAAPSEITPAQPTDEAIVTLLRVARQNFEYVVVDAGSRLDLKRNYSFPESTTLYLVTQLGIPELRNANRFIRRLPSERGPKLEIIVNRFDAGAEGIEEEHIHKALNQAPDWKIPNDYAAVRRMQTAATPITEGDSEIARAIRKMADSVCGTSSEPAVEKKRLRSFFSFSF